jgi:hypothetical protein
MSPAVRRCALLLLMLVAGLTPAGQPEPRLRLLVPAYFYPAGDGLKDWDRLIASARQVPILAIVNPASGPGEKADPTYTKLLNRAKGAPGLTLLGYVSTRYAKRSAAEVRADIDRWLRLYPQVQGLFLDEQASSADQADYYAALYAYARGRKLRLVVTNPGTTCAEAYLARPATDVGCLFEGGSSLADVRLPGWAARYGPRRVAALAYAVKSAGQMRKGIAAAAERGVGVVYVTDGTGANPWSRLPAYWDEEVAAVKQLSRGKSR